MALKMYKFALYKLHKLHNAQIAYVGPDLHGLKLLYLNTLRLLYQQKSLLPFDQTNVSSREVAVRNFRKIRGFGFRFFFQKVYIFEVYIEIRKNLKLF